MDAADEALAEAWRLRTADHDDEIEAKFEDLLPLLLGAGYAEATEYTWNFTPNGVARAKEIAPTRNEPGARYRHLSCMRKRDQLLVG